MALTGAALLVGFSRFIEDYWSSTSTSAGTAGGTTLIDTALSRYGEDYWRDFYVRPEGASNQYAIRRVSAFAASNGQLTVAPAFSAQAATAEAYSVHRYDPARKFDALDAARLEVFPDLGQLVFNEQLTTDGYNLEYDIPSGVRYGPSIVFIEQPLWWDNPHNFIQNPVNDSLTGWTASGTTAALVSYVQGDHLVPKYRYTCTRLATALNTAGTYTQTIANMIHDVTAGRVRGRRVSFGWWVYCRTASRITIAILDDNGTVATSASHRGAGWEFLSISGNVSAANATTFSARLLISSGAALDVYVNGAYFCFGDRVPEMYPSSQTARIRRDDTTQRIIFLERPIERRQMRLVGRTTLSALGTTASTQVTNTMELDAPNAELLYATAAQILFGWDGVTADDAKRIFERISLVQKRGKRHLDVWGQHPTTGGQVRSPWSR